MKSREGSSDTPGRLLPHELLMLACVSPVVTQETHHAADRALAAPCMDWPALFAQSVRHGTAQLTALHLAEFEGDSRIPAEVSLALARILEANRHRNGIYFREVSRLIRALESAGIRTLLVKGVPLALTVYPDPALRNFADADVLVDPENYQRATEIASQCGFQPAEPDPTEINRACILQVSEDILAGTLALEFNTTLARDKVARHCREVVVEIHRGLFRDSALCYRPDPLERLWGSAHTIMLPDGTESRVLCPEATLTHLAAHARDHRFARLIFPADICQVVTRSASPLDWVRVAELADQFTKREAVCQALDLACRVAREPALRLPPLFADAAGSGASFVSISLHDVFSRKYEDQSENSLSAWLQERSFRLLLRSALDVLFPPPAVMRRIYRVRSPLAVAICYLRRPFEVATRVPITLFRQAARIRRGRAMARRADLSHGGG